jgi:hypothetical protein
MRKSEKDYYEQRARAEIALALASGAKRAYASPDNKTVTIELPDGGREVVRIPLDAQTLKH